MADESCDRCGTARSPGDEFCPVCDTFFAWHDRDRPAGDASARTDPATVEMPAAPVAPPTPPAPPRPAAPPPRPADRVRPPAVSTETTEVVVTPLAPGTLVLQVRNGSSIVESYEIGLVDAPAWLVLTHTDANLLPDEGRAVVVTLAVAPGAFALAQRFAATVRVHSGVDRSRTVEVPVVVVVPRSGPPATLVAHPTLVRLQDSDRGTFGVRLDNRGANHPRRYTLSAVDAEGVVRVDFTPPVVEVPAGGTAEATARFSAPAPPPGKDASRQLTLTATAEDGPAIAQVSIAQVTSPEVERRPVKLRLEPSQVSVVDTTHVRLDLVVDHRGGHEPVVVTLRGHDPASALFFSFDHDGFTLEAGRAVRLGMGVQASPPPPGQTLTRPFTVVATAGGLESEIAGTLELTSRAAAVTTASLRLVPDHLRVSSRKGTFRVEVDNRRGAGPLHVALHGADEFGRASFRINPAQLTVPPGQVGTATAVVEHPKPDGGSSETRKVRVTAATDADALHAEASFTQESESYRRWWAYAVAVLGIATVALGALLAIDDLVVDRVEQVVRQLVDDAQDGSMPAEGALRLAAVAVSLVLVLLGLVMMLFGLIGTTGRGVRVGAIFAALFAGAAIVAGQDVGWFGLVIAGAVVAFVGGILLRQSRS